MLVQKEGKYLNLIKAARYIDFADYSPHVVATGIGLDPGWACGFGIAYLALLDDFRIVLYRYDVFHETALHHIISIGLAYSLQRPDVWGVDPIMFNHSWRDGRRDVDQMREQNLHVVEVRLPLIQRQSFMLRLWASVSLSPSMCFDSRMTGTVSILSQTDTDPDSQHCFDATSYGAYALIAAGKTKQNAPLFIEGD